MAEIPTSDSLYELSTVADRFVKRASEAIVFELDKLLCCQESDRDVNGAATECARLLDEAYNGVLSGQCLRTIQWFEAEPAFAMAIKSLSYHKVDDGHWEPRIQRELERWMAGIRVDKPLHQG